MAGEVAKAGQGAATLGKARQRRREAVRRKAQQRHGHAPQGAAKARPREARRGKGKAKWLNWRGFGGVEA